MLLQHHTRRPACSIAAACCRPEAWPPVALSAGVAHSQAKPDKLTILSHRVHMSVITGTKGGNAIEDWSKRNGVGIDWVTLDTGPLHERLFREASLGSTSIDMAFLLNTRATPNAVRLLEPLDPLMKADPLEDPADLFPGLVAAMKFGGQQYAVPHRHATTGFHYNEAIFKERGGTDPQDLRGRDRCREKAHLHPARRLAGVRFPARG